MNDFLVNDDIFKFLNKIKEAYESIDFDPKQEYKDSSLYIMCELLGKHGWVATGFGNGSELNDWQENIKNGKPDDNVLFFTDNNCENLNKILDSFTDDLDGKAQLRWFTPCKRDLLNRSVKLFRDEDYFLSALLQCLIIEYCLRTQVNEGIIPFHKRDSANNLLVKTDEKLRSKFSDNPIFEKRVATKGFVLKQDIPSLIGFFDRLFAAAKDFTIPEPTHINRNWLLHGMSEREVTQIDCIQLLNCLHTLVGVICYLREEDTQG